MTGVVHLTTASLPGTTLGARVGKLLPQLLLAACSSSHCCLGAQRLRDASRQACAADACLPTHCPSTGTVRVRGLLPSGCKMLDTPGVPHEFQLGTWLTAEEMRMVLPK